MSRFIHDFLRTSVASVLAALLTIQSAAAQTPATLPSYEVELIVFRHLSSDASPEQWQAELGNSATQLAIPDDEQNPFSVGTPAPAPDTATAFPPLPAAQSKLTAIADTLRRSRNYQPLAHIGWIQPGFARDTARYVRLDALVPTDSGITGQIALSRGRFLHLTFDLAYQAPATAIEPAQRYVLRQSRRVRSSERHYIDHPKFGVIAVVTPREE